MIESAKRSASAAIVRLGFAHRPRHHGAVGDVEASQPNAPLGSTTPHGSAAHRQPREWTVITAGGGERVIDELLGPHRLGEPSRLGSQAVEIRPRLAGLPVDVEVAALGELHRPVRDVAAHPQQRQEAARGLPSPDPGRLGARLLSGSPTSRWRRIRHATIAARRSEPTPRRIDQPGTNPGTPASSM
jgi:hypothetical protein